MGRTSLTYSNSAKDGGNNSYTLSVDQMPKHAHALVKLPTTGIGGQVDDGRTIQRGYAGGTSGIYDWTTLYDGTTEVGGSSPFDNRPNYKNCHIWYRQS